MGAFGILGQLAGGYADAADEAHEKKRAESRAMRMGLSKSLSAMLDDENVRPEVKNNIAKTLVDMWANPGKPFKFNPNDLLKVPEGGGAGIGAGLPLKPPPGPTPGFPAEVAAPSGGLPTPPTAQGTPSIFFSPTERTQQAANREEALAAARKRGTVAATPTPSPQLQSIQLDDPANPGQTIMAAFNPATGTFQDAAGNPITAPLAAKKTTYTPYRDFREGQIKAGVAPGAIPRLWNQQQIQLERENPSGMGLVISGVDTETGESVFRWVSPEERRKGVPPEAIITTRPRLGGGEQAKREEFIIQNFIRAGHTGDRLFGYIGAAFNPDLGRRSPQAIKAGRAVYNRWLKGGGAPETLPPPPGETRPQTSPPTTAEEYLRGRKPKR